MIDDFIYFFYLRGELDSINQIIVNEFVERVIFFLEKLICLQHLVKLF